MHDPTKNGMSQTVYMQKFKRQQKDLNLFLHKTTSFDLLNWTLYFGKINCYFISYKKITTKISKIKGKKKQHVTVSVIYVTLWKIVQIFIVVSLIASSKLCQLKS